MAVARTCAVECRRRSMSVIVARISGVLRSSCILLGGAINHEEDEGHGEFLGREFVLPIGYDQTISQPFIVAFMTEELRPQPTDRVLEIGTGSGYQAAVLAELVAEVYSIEIIEPLAKNAEATLQRLGYKNVHVKAGDGYKGWPEHAPF